MTYAQFGKVQAADFNALVGQSETRASTLNSIWGVGSGDIGYGQAPIDQVVTNDTVTAADWDSLINTMKTIGLRQGTTLTAMTAPAVGSVITYRSEVNTNLGYLLLNKNNATVQDTYYQHTVTNLNTWTDTMSFTMTVTFQSGDHARYFFNSGGQLAFNFSHPAGDRVDALFNSLCTSAGTVVFSAPSGSSTPSNVRIGGLSYDGVTKIGGTGTPTTRRADFGYYGLTTSNTLIFSQPVGGTPAKYYTYTGSNFSIFARTNGTQGSNGDNGSVLTFTVVWDQIPNGVPVQAGSATTIVVKPPMATPAYPLQGYPAFVNTWGTAVLDGTVVAS
jgi:hypothetical protein